MNNLTKNCKIFFFFLRFIQSVLTNKIIFIVIRIYTRISQYHRWEPDFNFNESVRVRLLTRLQLSRSHLREHKFRHVLETLKSSTTHMFCVAVFIMLTGLP